MLKFVDETIEILGLRFKIVYKDKNYFEKIDAIGRCQNHDCIIEVREDINDDLQQSVIIHEIIEAINYRLHLELEERQIDCLEAALLSIFKNNKDLLKKITE